MAQGDEGSSSRFWAFWTSLAGIITGIAGIVAAVGTIAALFVGGDDGSAPESGQPQRAAATAPAAPADGCFKRYFEGIPSDRIGTVEAGATDYDIISETQTKTGPIAVTFTNAARPIGAMRFAFVADSRVFRIESVVDARCRPVSNYENQAGGDKNVLQDSGTVRLQLARGSYDLTTIAWGGAIRLRFVPVVP